MSEKKAARILTLLVVLCLIVGMAVPVSAATVSGTVSPDGVLDFAEVGYTEIDAGLTDRRRFQYEYSYDAPDCYWATATASSVSTSYTASSTYLNTASGACSVSVFPSANRYVKLPFPASAMSDVSFESAVRVYNPTSSKLAIDCYLKLEFYDAGFNSLGSVTSTNTAYSVSSGSTITIQPKLNGVAVPAGAVYVFPRLIMYEGYSSNYLRIYSSGLAFSMTADVMNTYWTVPNVPVVTTSFDDQYVYIAEDEVFNLFVLADNINGTPSITLYAARELEDGTFASRQIVSNGEMSKIASGSYIGAWQYTPDADAAPYTIMFVAEVTNTIGSLSQTTQTELVIVNVTSYDDPGSSGDSGSSGDNSETLGKLEELGADMAEMLLAVESVGEKVDQLPGQIVDGMEQMQEQEKQDAADGGDANVGDLTEAIPDYSEGFMVALQGFADCMTSTSTAAVLTIPAINFPKLGGLVPEYQLLPETDVDFEQYVDLMPDNIIKLVRALLTIALIVYCFKELYGAVSYVLTLKGGGA